MAPVALITTALKAFTAFWSLVTMAVAGAFINKVNDIRESSGRAGRVGRVGRVGWVGPIGMLHGPGNGRRAVKAWREEELCGTDVVGDSDMALRGIRERCEAEECGHVRVVRVRDVRALMVVRSWGCFWYLPIVPSLRPPSHPFLRTPPSAPLPPHPSPDA